MDVIGVGGWYEMLVELDFHLILGFFQLFLSSQPTKQQTTFILTHLYMTYIYLTSDTAFKSP